MHEHTQTKSCTIPGCTRKYRARGWCATHYARWQRNGAPVTQPIAPTNPECAADGCTREPRSRVAEYCEKHYYRLRRNGTLETVAPRVPATTCVVDGCDRRAERTDGLCRACLYRFHRNGSFDYVGYRLPPELTTYTVVHQRVRAAKGSASKYRCVDCGRQARQWSYDHKDPGSRWGTTPSYPDPMPFSVSVDHYEPRCIPCHKRFDLAKIAERQS